MSDEIKITEVNLGNITDAIKQVSQFRPENSQTVPNEIFVPNNLEDLPNGMSSKDLTREEYLAMTEGARSHIAPEDYELIIFEDRVASKQVWNTMMEKFRASNIPIRPDLKDRSKRWKSKKEGYVAMIANKETKNIEVVTLLSRNNTEKFWVDCVVTMNPVSTQPFVTMILSSLKRVATEKGTQLMIPTEYGKYEDY
jgi:ATP-dependent Clp protease adapter protein ClpS